MASRKKGKSAKARKAQRPGNTRPARKSTAIKALATGPITLKEAQALVAASHPVSKARSAAVPPTNPADVGRARRDLEARRERERRRRIQEFTETLTLMKRRGARAPAPKGKQKPPAAAQEPKDASFKPLQILAEGDSWFDYPKPFFGGSIIPRLEPLLGVPILNLAKAGDEVRYMLGVKERKILMEQLTHGCPAGGPWDALLFSGGGNDIVDNPMALWVKDWQKGVPPVNLINQPRFSAALELVRAGYEDLILLRNRLSPDTHLFFHSYDFAIPDGRGVCFLGPWLKPTFDLRGFPTQGDGFAVVKELLTQFEQMQKSLPSQNITLILTQGTLAPVVGSWDNELHPEKAGFNAFAEMFRAKIKAVFPARVA